MSFILRQVTTRVGAPDIVREKPLAAAEPAESVYVVNSSSSPSSNLAAQIEVHHR